MRASEAFAISRALLGCFDNVSVERTGLFDRCDIGVGQFESRDLLGLQLGGGFSDGECGK